MLMNIPEPSLLHGTGSPELSREYIRPVLIAHPDPERARMNDDRKNVADGLWPAPYLNSPTGKANSRLDHLDGGQVKEWNGESECRINRAFTLESLLLCIPPQVIAQALETLDMSVEIEAELETNSRSISGPFWVWVRDEYGTLFDLESSTLPVPCKS
ncbi:hypothetical protein SISNIDRAFT_543575 [Sistotremastrum niveocremeum HHB9708]|uniref:Uncharacterized protein n=1 Tax=Sistotremastrum niveocremeum HHB9708 TaxID=1314777 RepID=A0A164WQ95_9AGAM|nr:hypothetical protein SISNIDRAFT_543575 [Sistotremastrum niveocremeum HHB9708]